MIFLLETIIFIGILCSLAFFRATRLVWTTTIGALLLYYSLASQFPGRWLGLFWIAYLIPAILFNVTEYRRKWLVKPLFRYFQQTLPPISQTEQEALDAGDVWWEAELFQGDPDWRKILKSKITQLTVEEQSFFDNEVNTLCTMLNDWQIVNEHHDLPDNIWAYLKKNHFFALGIDKKYGGLGFSAGAHAAIVTRIATRSVTAAVTVMVPNSLGPGELLEKYGTAEQKTYYLPRLARGEEIPCFALTAPDAGSDAASMPDEGIVCYQEVQGQRVLGMRLNFDKRYITLAPIATIVSLAIKLFDPDHLLSERVDLGITVCLIGADTPGVEIGNRHYPAGMAFMNGPIRGQNVFVPLENIVGGAAMVGQGWRMLMECLAVGRAISLPAMATANAELCLRTTGAYARVRKQFKTAIGTFEGVQESLGAIGGLTYLVRACQRMTVGAVDLGVKPSVASAIAKYHMTEMGRKILNHALDVHAGRGVQYGPRNYLANAYMGSPLSITVEGANILTRNLIIFGQGSVRCHPFIRQEMAAVMDPDRDNGLRRFDDLLVGHIGYSVSNFIRNFCYGLSAGFFIHSPLNGPLARYVRQLNRMSTALATVSDIAMMVLGGKLKRKERLSARLGDVLSYLYLASAVVKYYEEEGQPAEDLPLVRWALQYCLGNIQLAFDSFFANFPVKWLGVVLKRMVFPWGRAYHLPKDQLDRSVSKILMQPSALRDRLTSRCFIGATDNDPIYVLERALNLSIQAEPLLKKLHNAERAGTIARGKFAEQVKQALALAVLTAAEAELLAEHESARLQAIAVDEFPFNYFKAQRQKTPDNAKSKAMT